MSELDLIRRLVKAAKAGECPYKNCIICEEKWDTIREAEEYLREVDNGTKQ